MIFILAGCGIIFYSFFHFKTGLLIYLCYKLLLVTNITVISAPGLPLLTLEMAMTFIYIIAFFFTQKKYQSAHEPFPFKWPFLLVTLSMLVSSLFSIAGIGSEITNFIKFVSEDILLVWMAWQVVETKKDFRFLYKVITVIILISCIYGLIEYILKDNPLSRYEATLNHDPDKVIDWSYETSSRGYRINSIFEHAIGAGMIWALYAVATMILVQKERISIVSIVTAVLCIVCLFLSKMRSPIVFFVIAAFGIINLRNRIFYKILLFFFIAALLCMPFISNDVANVILSLFNQSAATVGGSSFQMRLDQFAAAFELMSLSPLFGLGPSFLEVMQTTLTSRLLGVEGVWLGVITQLGMFGIIVYLVQVYYFVIKLPKRYHSKEMFFMSLAYWVTYTITSLPGFCQILFYLYLFYFIKSSKRYQNAVSRGKVFGVYLNRGKLHYNVIKQEL